MTQINVNDVNVYTSNDGGLSPEVIANIAMSKIIGTVSANRFQDANEFHEAIYPIVLEYINRAIQSNYTS